MNITRFRITIFIVLMMILLPYATYGMTGNPNIDRPFVVKTFPADGERDIPINIIIKIMFNKQMDYLTFDKTSVMVTDSVGSMIDGVISYESRSYTLSFTPSSNLARGSKYTVFIPAYLVRDTDGNAPMENISFSFTTANDKSNIPELYSSRKNPKVLKHYPDRNGVNVPLDTTITFTMTMPLAKDSVRSDSVILNDGTEDYDVRVYYSESDNQILVVPERHLDPGKVYNVILKNNFRSKLGNRMLGNYIFSFSTRAARDDTPPIITETSPIAGGINVSINSRILVNFSEVMDPLSINSETFLVLNGNKPVEGKVLYDIRTKKAMFIPIKRLENDKLYTCLVTRKVKDIAGNKMRAPVEWTFKTRAKKVVIMPAITKTSPINGRKNIPVNSKILIYFNKAMSEATANPFNITMRDKRGPIPITTGFIKGGNFVSVIPTHELDYDKEYKVWISGDISDPLGNKLGKEYEFKFRTEKKPDLEPPLVMKVTPPEDSHNVPINSMVKVFFSEDINPETFDNHSIVLRDTKGLILKGSLKYNKVKKRLMFVPKGNFQYSTLYTAELDNNMTDLSGNRLRSAKIWKFTTVPPPDLIAPRVISTKPFDGEKDVSISTNVKIFFSEVIDKSKLSKDSIQIYDKNGNMAKGRIIFDETLKSLTFTPERNFKNGELYKVVVLKTISDKAGNYMKESKLFHFKTENPPDHIKPELVSVDPEPDSKNVSINKKIRATFTESLNPVTINVDTVFVESASGKKVPCRIDYLEGQFTILAIPKVKMDYDREMRLTISRKVTDLAGNRLASTIIVPFFTEKRPDHTPPVVLKITPENGYKKFNLDGVIRIKFNEALKDSSIDESNVSLVSTNIDESKVVPVRVSYISDDNTLVVAPAVKLEYETEYKLMVKRISDTSGNYITSPVTTVFRTILPPDIIPPRIVWSNPSRSKKIMGHLETIVVRFSEPIKLDTINGLNIDIRDINGTLPADIKWDASKNSMIIVPDNKLKPDSEYFLMVSDGITDYYDNKLANPMRLHFRTKKIVDLTPPKVVKISPDNDANMVPINEKVKIIFSESLNIDSINKYTVILQEDDEAVDYKIIYNKARNMVILKPKGDFKVGSEYRVTLTEGITDLHGNSLENPISWSFLVGITRRDRKFQIISLIPHEGMVDVSPTTNVVVRFSSEIDPVSLNSYTFFLMDGKRKVKGKVKISKDRREAIFKPAKRLRYGRTYRVKLTEGIKSLYGINSNNFKEYEFKTMGRR